MTNLLNHEFKLFVFNEYKKPRDDEDEEEEGGQGNNNNDFTIQMFGINEQGKKASILVENYKPFFYVKVGDDWIAKHKKAFLEHILYKIGKRYKSQIECSLINRKKLYGFDNSKQHRFMEFKFTNIGAFNKVKNLWYENSASEEDGKEWKEGKEIKTEYKLKEKGYHYSDSFVQLYEANIPPLLRFFHISQMSPSGWISFPKNKTVEADVDEKTTSCDYEFVIQYETIVPLNDKESSVPYKIMSFDIEASSSHGDFPVPIKSYKKLATNIVDYFAKNQDQIENAVNNTEQCKTALASIIRTAFNKSIGKSIDNKSIGKSSVDTLVNTLVENIDLVYPKQLLKDEQDLNERIASWFKTKLVSYKNDESDFDDLMFEKSNSLKKEKEPLSEAGEDELESGEAGETDEDEEYSDAEAPDEAEDQGLYNRMFSKKRIQYKNKESTIIDIMCDKTFEREGKITELIKSLSQNFPPLEGDKVTFIGSTFMNYREKEPYLNHCIVLNSCDKMQVDNQEIETYETERDVLVAWSKLVQRENPDIIIGYNIFSFDYEFMFRRSQELSCVEEFLKLSRNKDELCNTVDFKNPLKIDISRSSTFLASGTYELAIININGRLQVDMLNWFRRTENLTSYKLDYVGGYYIGDEIKKITHKNEVVEVEKEVETVLVTRIQTNNMTGLQVESYVHFEEFNHSSDYYKGGQKFKVVKVCKEEKWFEILGHETPKAKKIKWGLAKDDVTPKDIFRMTHEGPESRAIIAKYCIQDCNLVHHLFNKVDVVTDLVEMSKLCSVPMSFLIFRGQGIKLTSYVAKKCREKGVLMPCINKGSMKDGYEGAIVLDPKCGLYLEEAVCVGDFASLYPSSMLSENLCPSSKVWTKIYDLAGNIIEETGIRSETGSFIYDNLPEYEYIDVKFDTFVYIRKNPKAKAEKIKSGFKVCRFAQPLVKDGVEEKAIMPSILQELLKARKDTRKRIATMSEDEDFMKNILDKRQNAYKVTANSLYGQLGAKTSTFYEPDIAASTTATGRLLLTFAKKVVEECYSGVLMTVKDETQVLVSVEYIYGDTDSVFFKFNLTDYKTGERIVGQRALELSIELGQIACHSVSQVLKQPHDFEYEKTFMPFCLLSKKRYVAIKYEFDATKGKRNEMGIVLKRRDNAPIVKDIYGGVIDILMKEKNIKKAMEFVDSCLKQLVDGKTPIEKLIITKSLRSFYKKPESIAHKVLADRIAAREPGNKPTSGDRIPYVYFVNSLAKGNSKANAKKMLQGDKIETPTFIKENCLKIDYSFYITNQIMKPLLQLFGLVLEEIWMSNVPPKRALVTRFKQDIVKIREDEDDIVKCERKIAKMKDKEVIKLMFEKYLNDITNSKNGNQKLDKFFGKK